MLSADGALAVAAIGHAAHQPTEVVVVDYGVSQAAAAYQPAESGGIFDGVPTQAIESSVAATNPVVEAKTTVTATASAGSVAKFSTAATPISATSTTTSGSAVTQQLTTSLTVANAPPTSGNASQSSNNQNFNPKSNLTSNSSAPVFSSTVTPLIVTPAVDLVASINTAITAIAAGGPTTALDFGSATLGGILKLNTVHISFTVSGTTVTGVSITAASASLFPGNSDITGAITPTTAGGNGVVGQYNVTTKLFSLQIQKLHLTVGSAMTADASNFTLAYNPTGSASQLLAQINNATVNFTQFAIAGSSTNATVSGNLTSLTLKANGFQFAVAPLNYSGQVNLGPLLTIADPTVALTDFSVTFGADNATFTTTGSLTATAATATLNIGSGGTLFSSPDSQFSATATDLVMTVNLDPASTTAGFGDLAVMAGTVNFQFNDQLSVQASDVDIATNPAVDGAFLTVDAATSTLVLPVSGLTLHGTAEDFSVVNNAGNPELLKGTNFGVSIVATADQLKLPSWLTFKITSLEIKWADFVAKPDEFELVLNADITAIKNVTPAPNGTGVEGFISDAVINLELLDIGLFPITSIKGGGGNIDVDVFIGEIKATLIIGLVNINAEGGWIHEDGLSVTNADGTITVKNSDGTFTVKNPDGTTVANAPAVDNQDLTVLHSSFYVGARGTFDLPGMKGFSCEIGFSALGPLSFYLSVDIKKPIVIDPESGLEIVGMSGGASFNQAMPIPNAATDLRSEAYGTPNEIDFETFNSVLALQTVTQYNAIHAGTLGSASFLNAYAQPFILYAGVTLTSEYLGAEPDAAKQILKFDGTLAMGFDPSHPTAVNFLLTGTLTLYNSVKLKADIFIGLNNAGRPPVQIFLLADAPTQILNQATDPVLTIAGVLQLGFVDNSGNDIVPNGANTSSIAGVYLSIQGYEAISLPATSLAITETGHIKFTVVHTLTTTLAKLDFSGNLSVTYLGDLGTATGEVVVDFTGFNGTPSAPLAIYGALNLQTGSAFTQLEAVGLYLVGDATFEFNSSAATHTVTLTDATDPLHPITTNIALAPRSFGIAVGGSLAYEVGTDTLLNMQGDFVLNISAANGLTLYASLTDVFIGDSASPFFDFSGTGLFVINAQGFAAEINLILAAGSPTTFAGGMSLTGNFTLIVNTTSADVTFDIPSSLPPISVYDQDGNVIATLTTVTIPRGPPQGLADATGTFATIGATGPYLVIVGSGTLNVFSGLLMSGYFRLELSDSASGLQVSMAVNMTATIASATQSLTGAFQISNDGVLALLTVNAGGGTTSTLGVGITLTLNSQLAINTTSVDATSIGGIDLADDHGNPITVMAGSYEFISTGTLTFTIFPGVDFEITGNITGTSSNSVGGMTTTFSIKGNFTANFGGLVLMEMSATGSFIVFVPTGSIDAADNTVAGEITLSRYGSSNPFSATGFSFGAATTYDFIFNTSNVDQIIDGTTPVTIPGNLNGVDGPYFQVHINGDMVFGSATNNFTLSGDFYLTLSTGLIFNTDATFTATINNHSLLSLAATGDMEITTAGLIASFTLTASSGSPLSGTGFKFSGAFVFQVNTTADVVSTIGNTTLTTPLAAGPYAQIAVTGSLALGANLTLPNNGLFIGFYLDGSFILSIGSTGLAVSATATLTAKAITFASGHATTTLTLLSLTANGALLIAYNTTTSNYGIAAKISLTSGSAYHGAGFAFGSGVHFELDVNSIPVSVPTINNVAVNLAAGPYFKITASGLLTLASVININAAFTLTIGMEGLNLNLNGTTKVIGQVFNINTDAGIYSDGIEINSVLTVAGGGSVASFLSGVITVDAQFVLQINSSATHKNFGVAKNTAFSIQIHGSNYVTSPFYTGYDNAKIYIEGFQLDGQFAITASGSVLSATGQLSFSMWGIASANVDFYFDSAGNYWFNLSFRAQFGSSGYNVHGSFSMTYANTDSTDNLHPPFAIAIPAGFHFTVSGGVTFLHHDFDISVDIDINGSKVSVSHTFDFGALGHKTFSQTIGNLANTPATPTPPAPELATLDNSGVLTLNLGVDTNPSIHFIVTLLSINSDGSENVSVSDPAISDQPIEYDNVKSILANSVSADTTIEIDSAVLVPVVIHAGSGTNEFDLGGGPVTIDGSTGNDTIYGGTGNVTFTAGSNKSLFVGGGTGSTHNIINDPGLVTVIESGYNSYSLVGTSATSATLTYGGNTDVLNGNSITLSLIGAATGHQIFSVTNYSGPVTLDANGNSDVATSVTLDAGTLTLNGFVVTESNGTTGTITLKGINTLSLLGGAGATTFTINSWSGTGALTLDGKEGDDTYNINFLTSGSFAFNVTDTGSAGTDSLIINGTTGNDTIGISGTAVSLGTQVVNYSGVENLTVNTKDGNDTVNVKGTSAATIVNTGSGTNIINVGSNAFTTNTAGTLSDMLALLTLNASGTTTLNVDDTGDSSAATGTLTGSAITGLGMTSGIAYSGVTTLNISLGSGGNTFTITDTNAATTTTLNSGSAADTINLTTDSGTTTINAQAGDDIINVTNDGALTTINGGDGNDTVNVFGDHATTNIYGQNNDDTFNIQSTSAATTVDTGSGTNTINVGSLAPAASGIVDNILGAFTITGSGSDTLNVDDTGSEGNKTGTLTATTLTGLGMIADGIVYSGLITLTISLGSGDNTMLISATSSAATTVNGNTGADIFNVQATTGALILNGGKGDDTFNFGSAAPYSGGTVSNIAGQVTIDGGDGADVVNVDNTGDTTDNSGTLTATDLTGLGLGTGINYSAVETLKINLGSGDDTFNVQSTSAATILNTGSGANIVNVGSLSPDVGGIVDNIQGALTITGSGSDTLNVDDTGSEGDKTGTLTATTLIGLGMGESGITYSGLTTLTISLGSGNDTLLISSTASATTTVNGNGGADKFNVRATTGALKLNGGNGNDTFNFGTLASAVGGTVNSIVGLVTINGGGDSDTVNVDDTGDTASNTGKLTATSLTGLGLGAGINYSAVETLKINLGSGDDKFNVQGTSAVTTLNTGSGTNTINVGSLAPAASGIVDNIQGALTITGSGNDTLNVDDTGSEGNKTGTLTATTLTGLGMGDGGITYSGLTALNLSLGSGDDTLLISSTSSAGTTVNGDVGADTFNVRANTGALNLNGGSGNDIFNIGSTMPTTGGTVNDIVGLVTINGGGNSDTINVDDTGDTASNTGSLTATSLTGLGLGNGINYSAVETLNISLGSGGNTFSIHNTNESTATTLNSGSAADTVNVLADAGVTNVNGQGGDDIINVQSTNGTTTVNTGSGTNTVNVGSLAPTLSGGIVDEIQGALTVTGNGNDTLNVDDTGSEGNKTGTLTDSTLTGLAMGESGITYSGLATLNISLGSGNDAFTINSVWPTTVMTIDAKSGTDLATLDFATDVVTKSLTLLNFEDTTMYVNGDFTGYMFDSGPISQATITGTFTVTSEIDAAAINTMLIGGDLAGLINVVGLFNRLTVDGGTPGEIIAGDVNVITVLAGYGNKVLQVIEAGIERQIQATPTNLGSVPQETSTLPDSIHFAFVYDSETSGDPQLAIRITNIINFNPEMRLVIEPLACSFNLVLAVINSSTAKFNLSRVDSYLGGKTGVSNIAVQGDLLIKLTAPELQLFTDLSLSSSGGVMLAADSITGVEVSGRLPIGFIHVAGIEGLAFSVLTTALGVPVTLLANLGSVTNPQVLWNLLGSKAKFNAATDAFVVLFNETGSVKLYAHDRYNVNLELVMTFADQLNDNTPNTAYVQLAPAFTKFTNPLAADLVMVGDGGSVNSRISIANLTSTGSLGDVTITASNGRTVGGLAGLGNVTATTIFGSIKVTNAGIYGIIQTTEGDLGSVTFGTRGIITGVTTIFAQGDITGQIISRGNLISSVRTNGNFSGVIAAQGDIGVVQRPDARTVVINYSGALTRFGGIVINGNNSGQIITLGNLIGDVTIGGTMTGRMTAAGQTISGLASTRLGILGSVTVRTFAAGAAIVSGGLLGDAASKTVMAVGRGKGFLAAHGDINLKAPVKISTANLFANLTGANLSALNAIFTDSSVALGFDTGGNLFGLGLIETDLAELRIRGGGLIGTTP